MFSRGDRGLKSRESAITVKSVLVPVDGAEASRRAVDFACSLAKGARGNVHVVHVLEVRRSLPLDAELAAEAQRGEDILAQAEEVARHQDFKVERELLQARDAGPAIVDEANERQVHAIVLGVPFRRPYGEFELGRVAAYVLKSAQCQVILLRMPND